jgi:methionine-R-sulfoxide reductase
VLTEKDRDPMPVRFGFLVLAALLVASCFWAGSHLKAVLPRQKVDEAMTPDPTGQGPSLPKTDEEWRSVLTPEQYQVTRQKGTEAPFSGKYYKIDKQGVYRCVCCNEPLFSSDTKFDAHCGWPSFSKPIAEDHIKTLDDDTHAMHRTEVQCRKCGAHLGHVFDDGPQPTGRRYCINSVSLKLEEKKAIAAKPEAATEGRASSK